MLRSPRTESGFAKGAVFFLYTVLPAHGDWRQDCSAGLSLGAPINPDDQNSVHDFLQSRRGQLTLYIAAIIIFVFFIFTYFP